MQRNTLLLCLFFFALPMLSFATENTADSETVVTIKNAQRTSNKKSELDGSSIISLEGNVVVSVQKGDDITTISATSVNFNRENDILYAEGNVTVVSGDINGEKSETVTANSMLLNTATLEGIFDGGKVVRLDSSAINVPSDSTLIVDSSIFGRGGSGTISFKRGSLTFCPANPPHWRIKASRIWMLPGGEFAFFNALVYVGRVPLLYLPAFWYPKDELVFNPVFGYTNRQGYFFQTTTYLYGRKPLEAYDVSEKSGGNSSSYSFVKPQVLKDQERQGLMLHNLDTDYKGDTTNYAKIMADWYATQGVMTGIEGVYKDSEGPVTDAEGSLRLGFSNTVFRQGNGYLSYSPSGKQYKDTANFLGASLPFRYSSDAKFNINGPFSLSLSMPLYSDPYFTNDFGKRSETMDWIDFLLSNPSENNEEIDEDSISELSSFIWSLEGSWHPNISDALFPYVADIAITDFSSRIVFATAVNTKISRMTDIDDKDRWRMYTPERKFFYPSMINPITLKVHIGGTLLSFGNENSSEDEKKLFDIPLVPPENLAETNEEDKQSEGADTNDKTAATALETTDSTMPDIAFSPPAITNIEGVAYNLAYSVSPGYTTEISYATTSTSEDTGVWLNEAGDFKWDKYRSFMHSVDVPMDLTSTASYGGGFLGLTDSLEFHPFYQWHPYLSDDTRWGGYTDDSIKAIKEMDYDAQKMDVINTNALVFRPFWYTEHFKNTGIAWNTTVKLFRTEFAGDADNPRWNYMSADLGDEESVTAHNLALTLSANERGDDFGQSLILTSTLPPQVDEYCGKLELTFPCTILTAESGIRKESAADDKWIKEDFKQSLSVRLWSGAATFSESFNYNLEEDYSDSLKLSVSLWDLQVAYTARYVYGYDFVTQRKASETGSTAGWQQRNKRQFLPYTISVAYNSSDKQFNSWKHRIGWKPSLSTGVVYDFIRPTNSYFKFVPALTFQINKFLNLTFASESRNDVIYRYFQSAAGHPGLIEGETNVFRDLLDSFRFDDEEKRRASGFKLNALMVKITHELCDWDFSATFKVSPRLITDTDGKKYYDFSPYFTLSVVWRPMSGLGTSIVDEYGAWRLNP